MIFGFIGCGKMATALAQGAAETGGIPGAQMILADAHPASAERLGAAVGAEVVRTNAEVSTRAEVIVLCVKPADAVAALEPLQPQLAGRLLLSIVAGLPLAALQEAAGSACRVIRVMPNTPALVRQGVAAYACGAGVTPEDEAAARRLFGSVGQFHRVEETLLDAVTGLSGSGPAYVFLIIEALADGGVLMGLPRALAHGLAAGTVAGAAAMVLAGEEHPAVLREAVTSPGGTTAAGLEVLERHGVRGALQAAVRAAAERAQALGAK